MYRQNLVNLKEWFHSARRKPTVLRGARQVGKTWLVRQLAQEENLFLIELNFEKSPQLVELFNSNEVKIIIRDLEATLGQNLTFSKSLLFLDEIQAAPQLLAKLRWFAEELPELAVIAAGSLLDFALKDHSFSMPVGRVGYMYVQPMSFEEFLLATDRKQQLDYLQSWQLKQEIPLILHDSLLGAVREFIFVGGMPEAITAWNQEKSFISVAQVQQDLLANYRDDFTKYNSKIDKQRLDEVLRSVPNMLGEKFQYKIVNPHVQASTIKNALNLLITARLVHKVQCCAATGLPLGANINHKIFKTVLLDVGLVSALLKLITSPKLLASSFSLDNSGGITEQYVAQSLLNIQPFFIEPELFYWLRDKTGASAEIDYVIQHQDKIIPLEVKAGSTGTLRSLHLLMELRGFKHALRINSDTPSVTDMQNYKLLSMPFYLTGQLPRLLEDFVVNG